MYIPHSTWKACSYWYMKYPESVQYKDFSARTIEISQHALILPSCYCEKWLKFAYDIFWRNRHSAPTTGRTQGQNDHIYLIIGIKKMSIFLLWFLSFRHDVLFSPSQAHISLSFEHSPSDFSHCDESTKSRFFNPILLFSLSEHMKHWGVFSRFLVVTLHLLQYTPCLIYTSLTSRKQAESNILKYWCDLYIFSPLF